MISIAHQKGPAYSAMCWRYVLKLTLVVMSLVLFSSRYLPCLLRLNCG